MAETQTPAADHDDSTRRINRLTLTQQMQAAAWLREHREEVAIMPKGKVAAALAEHLQNRVSVRNLEYIAGAADVRLHSYKPECEFLPRRIEALEHRVDKLAEIIYTMRQPPLKGAEA